MKPSIIIAIVVSAVAVIGAVLFFVSADGSSSVNNSEANSITQRSDITTDEVSSHNTEDDCWTIIDGSVYDITSYVPRHPGGEEILRACGVDGSSLFNQRQTESGEEVGSGSPHSRSAQSQLADLKIGTLSE